jgi:hypothetical protein
MLLFLGRTRGTTFRTAVGRAGRATVRTLVETFLLIAPPSHPGEWKNRLASPDPNILPAAAVTIRINLNPPRIVR